MFWGSDKSSLLPFGCRARGWLFGKLAILLRSALAAEHESTTLLYSALLQSTGLVVKHIEDWDVEPGRVLRQLLRPAARLPGNRWEAGMRALHDGDVLGVWQAAAAGMLKATAVATPLLLAVHAVRGEGLPVSLGAAWLAAKEPSEQAPLHLVAQAFRSGPGWAATGWLDYNALLVPLLRCSRWGPLQDS